MIRLVNVNLQKKNKPHVITVVTKIQQFTSLGGYVCHTHLRFTAKPHALDSSQDRQRGLGSDLCSFLCTTGSILSLMSTTHYMPNNSCVRQQPIVKAPPGEWSG